jgi:hypothetical protein
MKYFFISFLILISLISLLFTSCKHNSTLDNSLELKIDVDNAVQQINLSEISKNSKIIKLYTDSVYLIGDIRNIIYAKKIYVQNMQKILVFNSDGSPSYSINNRGKAGGEYYEIDDFYVDTVNNIVEVWDRVNRKILVYDDITGDFIKTYSLDLDARFFKKLKEYYFFYSDAAYAEKGEKKEKIYCLDSDKKVIKKYLNSDYITLYSFSTPQFLSTYNENIYFDDAPLCNIYKINKRECKIAYKINIGNNSITKEEFLSMEQLRSPERSKLLRSKYNYSIGQTVVYENGIKLTIFGKGKGYFCFYNPINNHYHIGPTIYDDSYLKIPIWYTNINNNKLICQIPTYKIINSKVDYGPMEGDNPELYKMIKNLKKFDNPILIISDLKEF